ncbi:MULTISPECIES: bifunctional metallophosphatase/5'-nucleotidase [unclassified Nocardioides]|uniref:bifunctional metallophosphatase/5'-nucleotidase n=1 Tax=unclassified Nocardioides TaxID=2615069 RepID=UPI001E354BA5|nr:MULTISPECIES: 5'-nucleotidase C-terminal domain-containing protein [unclassified Nocardioides]
MASSARFRSARRCLGTLSVLAVSASSLALVVPAAHAADPVEITLLNINDFHGRIDANTTKFATTVEQLRAEAGEDNTLLLSAGDNIGASLFASSLAQDQPTIEVLNALGLATSAVGNHEFDRGFADLTGRVAEAAEFSYLGANVYEKGTQTPALQEYDEFEVAGVSVGVIGVVTEETPSLVTPTGTAGLDFGDPVEAVNRVAGELSDGDEANGEADVIVAEYHEGAGAGTPDGATLEEEVAAGGVFAAIVEDTSPEVDAIFTGHTHKEYAWEAPVPGTERTRPVVQTGSYGEHVGHIELTVDPETGEVSAATVANVDRVEAEDLTLPRVAEVKRIVDAALAAAAAIGNEPVATITGDITTAFSGGSYIEGRYVGPGPEPTTGRDDRAAESTLGGLVANALWEGMSEVTEVDLGITNPGGLRADLLFAGSTAGNPANTDGVVTFAEANAVLPFSNTVATVDLTGAQLDEVLEQQWQRDDKGEVPSRPYLQLGLSENVRVTTDPTRAEGDRVTSIRIDGELVDPAATYTVSTLSFLAAGGDNFRAFAEGRMTDTGLLDAELWRDYLAEQSPIAPDFARQQVVVTGNGTAAAGRPGALEVSMLDLTSLGSPANTTLRVSWTDGTETVEVGEVPVVAGAARVPLDLPARAAGGTLTLLAQPSGTTIEIPIVRAPKSVARLTVAATPRKALATRTRVLVTVKVSADDAVTGAVKVLAGGQAYSVRLNARGQGRVRIAPFQHAGARQVKAIYTGDELTKRAVRAIKVQVARRR